MSKILHAFYECVEHGFKDITESKYVARNGKCLADYLLKNKEEKDLVSLLQSGVLSQDTLNYIYDKIPDNMTIARAYALENTGHRNTGFSL